MSEAELIKSKLSDKRRRISSGVLYKIIDKDGKLVPFIPNEAQSQYRHNKHNLNVIVKARQLGFSTMIQIDFLDDALFSRNFSVGVIAQDQESAINIFNKKIKVAFDNLPKRLKDHYILKTDRSNELKFSNTGSSIRVATGFRSDTLQRLHISEYGKICAKYPLTAKEIKEGSLEAVGKGNVVTIESTAEGGEGEFYEIAKRAKEITDAGRTPNEMEWKLHFFPRYLDSKYKHEGTILRTQEEEQRFDDYRLKNGIVLTEGQKNRYTLKSREKGEGMLKEYPTTFDEAFNLSIKGAYYEKELTYARVQRRIGDYKYNHQLLVNTAWDLGGSGGGDDTAIWFYQLYDGKIFIIDYREGTGYSRDERINIVLQKPYKYYRHIGPHDLNVNFDGQTRADKARARGLKFEQLPSRNQTDGKSLSEGIDIVRSYFPRMYFNEETTSKGLRRLSVYRRSRDEANSVFRDRPEHNGASHASDALRYLCLGQKSLENEKESIITDFKRDKLF